LFPCYGSHPYVCCLFIPDTMDSSRQLQATNEGKWRFLGMDGKRWILIVSFLGCIQGKSVVKLVGRQGNAGAGEVAAVAMGFCLVS